LDCKGFFTITGEMWVSWNMKFIAYLHLVIWFRTHEAIYNTSTPSRNGATRNNGTYISYKGFRRKWFWLCWGEHKLLVELPMPHRSKGRGQIKGSPGPTGWGLGMGLTLPWKNLLLLNLESPWRRPRLIQGCSANKGGG
jgi:hypothetical protein